DRLRVGSSLNHPKRNRKPKMRQSQVNWLALVHSHCCCNSISRPEKYRTQNRKHRRHNDVERRQAEVGHMVAADFSTFHTDSIRFFYPSNWTAQVEDSVDGF